MNSDPRIPSLDLPAIAELARLGPRFVTWRLEPGAGGKPTKPPYRVYEDVKASTNDPATWGTFQEAMEAIEGGADRSGIGFIPRPAEDGILAVDLDGCIDPSTGEIADWAQRIVDDLDSYTEISPSWAGLKIFVRGAPMPRFTHKEMKVDGPKLSDKEPQIELLGLGNRYTTLTGMHFGGTPVEIRDATDALLELAEWMERTGRERGGPGQQHVNGHDHSGRGNLDAERLLRAAELIPNPDLTWGDWNDVGMRFWAASGGSEAGRAAFDAFSRKSSKYEERATRERWQGLTRSPPTRYGATSLIGLAQQYDPEFRDPTKDPPGGVDFSAMLDQRAAGVRGPAQGEQSPPKPAFPDFSTLGAEHYDDDPEPIQWLVQDVIPLGVGCVLAGMGDVGKSFKLLEMCFRVACPLPSNGNMSFNTPLMGGDVVEHGTAVFVTSEDGRKSVHRRLKTIDPTGRRRQFPGKLVLAPMPDLGGTEAFFVYDPRKGLKVTAAWENLCDQCRARPDLKLVVIDPASAFAHVNLDTDTTHAYFVANHCAALASETGATVILAHHLNKGQGAAPKTLAEARSRIKGNCGLVDGMRLSYVMWQPDEADGKKVCKALSVPFLPNSVVLGGVVKTNDDPSREISIFVRTDGGILLDRTACLRAKAPRTKELLEELTRAIIDGAAAGQPYTHTGDSGLHKQRHRLPRSLKDMGRDRLEKLGQELLDEGVIIKGMAGGSTTPKWLDIRTGQFGLGIGKFKLGWDGAGNDEAGDDEPGSDEAGSDE